MVKKLLKAVLIQGKKISYLVANYLILGMSVLFFFLANVHQIGIFVFLSHQILKIYLAKLRYILSPFWQ